MIKTQLDVFDENQFDCDYPHFLKEVIENSDCKMYGAAWNVFLYYIRAIATRATELNDPVLNALMLKMGLYEVPIKDRKKMIKKCEHIYNKLLKENQ